MWFYKSGLLPCRATTTGRASGWNRQRADNSKPPNPCPVCFICCHIQLWPRSCVMITITFMLDIYALNPTPPNLYQDDASNHGPEILTRLSVNVFSIYRRILPQIPGQQSGVNPSNSLVKGAEPGTCCLVGVGLMMRPSFTRQVSGNPDVTDNPAGEYNSRHSMDGKYLFIDPRYSMTAVQKTRKLFWKGGGLVIFHPSIHPSIHLFIHPSIHSNGWIC